MPQLPTPIRAALGLAAEAAEQARHLPDRAIELPMLAVSTALQLSLRAQQRYAMLAARGEEILNHREPTDEAPPWATFDAPVDIQAVVAEKRAASDGPSDSPVDGASDSPSDSPADGVMDGSVDATDGVDANRARPAPGKSIKRPRNGAPSRFDAIGDE